MAPGYPAKAKQLSGIASSSSTLTKINIPTSSAPVSGSGGINLSQLFQRG